MPLGEVDVDPVDDAFIELRDEFTNALLDDPIRLVKTPGADDGSEDSVARLLALEAAADPGYEHFEVLLREIVNAALRCPDADTRLRFMNWIGLAGERHARRHQAARVIENTQGARSS